MSSSAGGPPKVFQWECGTNPPYIRAWKQDCPENPPEQRQQRREKKKSRFLRMYLSSMVIRTWLEASRPNKALPFLIFLMPGSLTWKLAIKSHRFYTNGSLVLFFLYIYIIIIISLALSWNGHSNKIEAKQQFSLKKKRWKNNDTAARAQLKSIAPVVKPALRGTAPGAEG